MYPRIEGGGLRRYRIKVHRALYVFKEHGTSVEGTLPSTLFFYREPVSSSLFA